MKTKFGEFCSAAVKSFGPLGLLLALLAFLGAGCTTSRNLEISTVPVGATIIVNGQNLGPSPAKTLAQWPNKQATVVITAQKPDYQSQTKIIGRDEAGAASDPWSLNFKLVQIAASGMLDIGCNVPDARVWINSKELKGGTPARVKLTFTRKNASSPWSTMTVVVAKDKYEFKPASGPVQRYFMATLSPFNFPPNGQLYINLQPIEFYPGLIMRYLVSGSGVAIQNEYVLSQVGEIETEPRVSAVTMVSDLPTDLPLVETKLSVTPEGDVVYTLPVWESGQKTPKGANLWMEHGVEKSQLTDGNYFDLAPSVTADGKWIYFSSDRSGKFNLWRIQANGKGGIGQITDSPSSQVDYEPVLSPNGQRLAYTSLRNGSRVPQIWFCGPDGSLQTQICEGSQPAWSPDSSKLAYVATDDTTKRDDIWIMDGDGSNPRCIAQSADSDFRHPVWTPDGRSIVYDADAAVNTMQKPNFDIWKIDIDGTGQTQLTVNGSYDADPAVSPDGKSVYFLSNRGVQQDMQDNLQIWRLDLLSSH